MTLVLLQLSTTHTHVGTLEQATVLLQVARLSVVFLQAYGRDQIGVQFYGMRRCVKGISVALEKVEVLNSTAKSSSGTYQLRIISRISFFLPSLIRQVLPQLCIRLLLCMPKPPACPPACLQSWRQGLSSARHGVWHGQLVHTFLCTH